MLVPLEAPAAVPVLGNAAENVLDVPPLPPPDTTLTFKFPEESVWSETCCPVVGPGGDELYWPPIRTDFVATVPGVTGPSARSEVGCVTAEPSTLRAPPELMLSLFEALGVSSEVFRDCEERKAEAEEPTAKKTRKKGGKD
jgi:hypothetical protein